MTKVFTFKDSEVSIKCGGWTYSMNCNRFKKICPKWKTKINNDVFLLKDSFDLSTVQAFLKLIDQEESVEITLKNAEELLELATCSGFEELKRNIIEFQDQMKDPVVAFQEFFSIDGKREEFLENTEIDLSEKEKIISLNINKVFEIPNFLQNMRIEQIARIIAHSMELKERKEIGEKEQLNIHKLIDFIIEMNEINQTMKYSILMSDIGIQQISPTDLKRLFQCEYFDSAFVKHDLSLNEHINSIEEKIIEMSEIIENKNKEIQNIKNEFKNESDSNAKTIQDLSTKLTNLTEEMKQLKTGQQDQDIKFSKINETIENVSKNVSAVKNTCSEIRQERESDDRKLRNQINNCSSKIGVLKKEIYEIPIDEMQSQIYQIKTQNDQIQTKIQQKNAEIDQKCAQIDSFRYSINHLQESQIPILTESLKKNSISWQKELKEANEIIIKHEKVINIITKSTNNIKLRLKDGIGVFEYFHLICDENIFNSLIKISETPILYISSPSLKKICGGFGLSTWRSINDPDSGILIDFKKMKFSLKKIIVQNPPSGNDFIKEACIEGKTNELSGWNILCTLDFSSILDKSNKQCACSLRSYSDFYRFYRFKLTDKNQNMNYTMCISGIDFYGILKKA